MDFHPGGEEEMMKGAGREATDLFNEVGGMGEGGGGVGGMGGGEGVEWGGGGGMGMGGGRWWMSEVG